MAKKKEETKRTKKSNTTETTMHDRIQAAAADLNSRNYFEPPYDLKASDKVLEKNLKADAGALEKEDELDDATWELFAEWGVGPRVDNKNDDGEEEGDGDGEEEEEEEEEPAAEPVDVSAELKEAESTKKIDDLKRLARDKGIAIPPPFLKDIKKLRPYVIEKLEAYGRSELSKKKKGGKKTAKSSKITRAAALAMVLKDGETDKEKIFEKSNALYVKNGGKDNVKEAKWMFGFAANLLTTLGFAKDEGETFKINE